MSLKEKGTDKEKTKARFDVQGHTDAEKNILIHNSTAIRPSSTCILISLTATYNFKLWSQDITRAYQQSNGKLSREVYIRPTKRNRAHFGLQENELLLLLKTLYGLADAGDYWHATFSEHLTEDLQMKRCIGDLSMFYKVEEGKIFGFAGAYVDDEIATGNLSFEDVCSITEAKFDSKKRTYSNFKFASVEVHKTEYGYILNQTSYIRSLRRLDMDCSYKEFRSRRHEMAWIGHTRPDTLAGSIS